jgi:hypothetical protein
LGSPIAAIRADLCRIASETEPGQYGLFSAASKSSTTLMKRRREMRARRMSGAGAGLVPANLTALGIDDLDIDDEVTSDNPVAQRERGLSVSAESDESRVGIRPRGKQLGVFQASR